MPLNCSGGAKRMQTVMHDITISKGMCDIDAGMEYAAI